MTRPDYEIESIESQPFGQVSYIVRRADREDALVVDPGFEPERIVEALKRSGRRVAAILNTHGHVDHIAGNRALKSYAPDAPIVTGRREAHLLVDPEANLSAAFGLPITSPPADQLLNDGQRIELAGIDYLVLEIPGHSPGSIVLIADQFTPRFALVGDVLFAGSVGRTDFPGGSAETLIRGIRAHLFAQPDDTRVLPGHGPTTTVGRERRSNPFAGDLA